MEAKAHFTIGSVPYVDAAINLIGLSSPLLCSLLAGILRKSAGCPLPKERRHQSSGNKARPNRHQVRCAPNARKRDAFSARDVDTDAEWAACQSVSV